MQFVQHLADVGDSILDMFQYMAIAGLLVIVGTTVVYTVKGLFKKR